MRLFRSLTVVLILIVGATLVGGYYMRTHIIALVRNRSVSAASVVFARPFPVGPGASIESARLIERLNNAGYKEVSTDPSSPGEYRRTTLALDIYLRGDGSQTESSRPISMLIVNGTVDTIRDKNTGKTLSSIELDPEPLSFLGSSATRVSTPKPLSAFPSHLIEAILAIEDERFYVHYGIDPLAIIRALVVNLQSGKVAQGGSTLTQQLAKNLLLTRERSLARKAQEAVAAVLIETAFSKEQILELYLNEVFLGQEGSFAIHGFAEAARSFFGKEVSNISLAEAATLAAMIKAPTRYSPRRNPDLAKERRQLVLAKMADREYILEPERESAASAEVKAIPALRTRRVAPYFVDYIRRSLESVIETSLRENDSLHVYTSLDRQYQLCAEDALTSGLVDIEKRFPKLKRSKGEPLQGALISVLPTTGEIVAWAGGRDYSKNQFDRVSQALRQPGSTFKPFVYLTALDKQLNSYRVARTTSLLEDRPISFEVIGTGLWTPENFDNEYSGEATVREALVRSLNVPTVNLAMKVGMESIKNTAGLFGFGDNLMAVPSLALGAGEVSPLSLARAYAAIANGGTLLDLKTVSKIILNGSPLTAAIPAQREQRAASEAAVYVLTNILQDAVNRGTGRAVRNLGYTGAVAGKTGTSNDARDAWFSGFTPHLLTIVWVGFDDNSKVGLTGGQLAAPIWTNYMRCVQPMEPDVDFIEPPGVVHRTVDKTSGLLATEQCSASDLLDEVFVAGTEPVTLCPHGTGEMLGADDPLLDLPEAPQPPPAPSGRSRSLWDSIFNGT